MNACLPVVVRGFPLCLRQSGKQEYRFSKHGRGTSRSMTFIILDPNLTGAHGHHLGWDLAIASAAIAWGERVTIYANRSYGLGATSGVDFIPHFTRTTYERRSPDPFSAAYDDFEYFNATLAAELAALTRQLRPEDIVLVPTTSEHHLLGYIRWMRSFPRAEAPDFAVLLMFPTGLTLEADEVKIIDPFRVLFYRLAFRKAEEEGPEISTIRRRPSARR